MHVCRIVDIELSNVAGTYVHARPVPSRIMTKQTAYINGYIAQLLKINIQHSFVLHSKGEPL